MTNFFYIAKQPHNVGDMLGGGNFGRGYDLYVLDVLTQQGAENGWKLASEMIVEAVRQARYPHMPSRLTCSYAYPDEQEARNSMAGAAMLLHLYEVELVDSTKPCYTVARNLMSAINRMALHVPFAPNNRALADQYWSGQGITHPEVITESPLRVVRRMP